MFGHSPGHGDRHRAQRAVLGFREPADPFRDPLEPGAIACRETRERLAQRRAVVKQRRPPPPPPPPPPLPPAPPPPPRPFTPPRPPPPPHRGPHPGGPPPRPPFRPDVAEPLGVFPQRCLAPSPHGVHDRCGLRERLFGHGVAPPARQLGDRAQGQQARIHGAASGFAAIGRRGAVTRRPM